MENFHGGVEWPDGINPFNMGFMAHLQQGGECITQQGLIFLANEQFGAGNWATRTEILSEAEGKVIRAMMRLPDDAELLILRGVFEVPAKGLVFTQLGTVRQNTLRGFIKFDTYPVEMASTRAVNRATRFAVGAPVSKDEIGDDGKDTQAEVLDDKPANNGQPTPEPEPQFDGKYQYNTNTKEIELTGLFPSKDDADKAFVKYLLDVIFPVKDRTEEQLLMAREVMEMNLDRIATQLHGENLDAVTQRFTELKFHIQDESVSA